MLLWKKYLIKDTWDQSWLT